MEGRNAEQLISQALAKYKIRMEFSDACLSEAQQHLDNSHITDPALTDWRDIPFVTIDNPDSRDLDQALFIERVNDGYRLLYALADASYYIAPGSALFAEALARGTTYYTPSHAVPMLPTVLSEGLISLNPKVDRRALVFDIRFSPLAVVVNTTIVNANIQSHAKLNYGQVQEFLDASENSKQHELSDEPFNESLLLLKELGSLLVQKALERDVVPFNRKEAQIAVSGGKLVSQVRTRYETEKYNEQMSLVCNMQGALILDTLNPSTELQAIYRVHNAPLKSQHNKMIAIINAFADDQTDKQTWLWKNGQSLAEYVASLPQAPEYARRVAAIERQILVSNRASYFTHESGAHHALAATSYARFSSPMREVVGIYTHKELLEALANPNTDGKINDSDIALRDNIIEAANQSRKTQKALRKNIELQAIKTMFDKDIALETKPVYSGTIMGFRGDRVFVSLDNFASDIKVYSDAMEAQYKTDYRFSDISAVPADASKPVWRLGDAVQLSVDHYDPRKHRFAFKLETLS